jgi:hypothetical protein
MKSKTISEIISYIGMIIIIVSSVMAMRHERDAYKFLFQIKIIKDKIEMIEQGYFEEYCDEK